ncbi:MAG: cyclic nucleotide-binding domain-containing protein [Synechocystis sp.]|nr:cyclic nucleotide-binding domain-containing protein [Synechocystis sp.]
MNNMLMTTVRLFENRDEIIYPPGKVIFQEGENSIGVFGIVTGEVDFYLHGNLIETLHAGDVFGMGAILHEDHLRASTAIAKTETRLACLDREHFLFAIQEAPMFALQVIQGYSNRYRRLKTLYQAELSRVAVANR